MSKHLSDTVEDYLKTIYKLSGDQSRVGTGQIAEILDVSPASVTVMVQRLAAEVPPLLNYAKHKGVELTEQGRLAALEIIRHHRLLELFLHEVLGYSWDQVHAEADRLEHVISEEFEERVAEVLGDPARGLHGEPIPSRSLVMPDSHTSYLLDMRPNQHGRIREVNDDDPGLLRFLESRGIVPGVMFQVLDYSTYDDNLRLKLEGNPEEIVLGASVTSQVLVEETESEMYG
jgi:DtxR family transcriptional regulator, Mn-dependent transcriptional regulator